jgi:hypothetical protein
MNQPKILLKFLQQISKIIRTHPKVNLEDPNQLGIDLTYSEPKIKNPFHSMNTQTSFKLFATSSNLSCTSHHSSICFVQPPTILKQRQCNLQNSTILKSSVTFNLQPQFPQNSTQHHFPLPQAWSPARKLHYFLNELARFISFFDHLVRQLQNLLLK